MFAEDAVGTNGLATTIEPCRTTRIDGYEHCRDALASVTCVGVPVFELVLRFPPVASVT